MSKKLAMAWCQQIMTLLSFFRLMSCLEESTSRILDAWCVILTFSLTVIFYLIKKKKIEIRSHTIALGKGTAFAKTVEFFQEHVNIIEIKGLLVLNGIFRITVLVCVPKCQLVLNGIFRITILVCVPKYQILCF